ncbi:hypothetical protein [Actinomadura macra]|uniref:hypothetical protein n=1 Tax=Actinomadura macra TaxID=46164 RepID=UPI000836305A|nr:hypothetical protein [Actinomadura macra]
MATVTRQEAMRAAAQVLVNARARIALMTPEEAARAAYIPGGPSLEELAAKVRHLREQARSAARKETPA